MSVPRGKLPKEALERVERLRKKYPGQYPVPVVEMAKDLGVDVFESEDFSDDESGLIRKENGRYAIYINALHPPTRKLFTVGHELAHFLLHQATLDAGEEHVDGTQRVVGTLHRSDPSTLTGVERKKERDANALAAEILMPEREFKRHWEKIASARRLEAVADRFGVSTAAASWRAVNVLGYTIL